MIKRFAFSLAVFALIVTFSCTTRKETTRDKVNLVVLITVDQLRGDMPHRFKERFGPNGFMYLMERGVYYADSHYKHSTTFTAVGHATLVTGGYAALHGIPGNDWYDRETGKHVFSVEDDRYTLIGEKPIEHGATSPRNLTSSTIGDELVLASGHRSKVFSVSLKDRGAIIPGGHLGKAFWYSFSTGKFVTSTYYYDEYPAWVAAWNRAKYVDRYRGQLWTLMRDKVSYVYGNRDDRSSEKSYYNLGRTFPHTLDSDEDEGYYRSLAFTPYGDELTLAFAKALIEHEKLGQGDAIDMLAISFSATDLIGHAFGPLSLEYEDNLLRLDVTLSNLFTYIDEVVGLDKTLIVLSADHGVDEIPEEKKDMGFQAGRHYPNKLIESANAALQKRFNSRENFVVAFWNPSFYLNQEAIRRTGLDPAIIERALVEEILRVPGIAVAVSRTDLLAGNVTASLIMQSVQRAFHPRRSGDVIIVQDQFWYLYSQADAYSAMHGSPYSYDTYVPIVFAGPGIKPQMVYRPVAPASIAPSLALYLGIKPPSASRSEILAEVLGEH